MNRLPSTLIALVLFAAAVSAQMYPATWKLAHPDAKALIGLDVRGLRESQAGQAWSKEFEKSSMGVFPLPGLELLKQIDQVLISSPGGTSGHKKQNPPVLIVLTGHFNPEQLHQFFPKPHRVYGLVDIYGTGASGDLNFALLDEHTLLLGDDVSMRGAIDRNSQRPNTQNELLTRASAMAADHDFWLIATVSPSTFQPASVNLGQLAADIQRLDTGFSLRDGFRFELGLTTKTPEEAQQIAQMITEQVKRALASNLDVQEGADILQKLEVNSDGTRMDVKIALNQEETDRMIQTAQAAQASHQTTFSSPKPLPDEGPKTIKILGLDEGVREIPFSSRSTN